MQYKLIDGSLNDVSNPIKTIFNNRGIEDVQGYLSLDVASRTLYKDLDYIEEAVEVFDKHFQAGDSIGILMDNDVDGISSAAIMYEFIKALNEDYDVRLYVHERNKSHGLDDRDFAIDDDVTLLIVPDAGSNDLEAHIELQDKGVDCICLDHHQVIINIKDSPAIIVNNQSSDNYTNKNCCGAHVTLEFCRALEELYWVDICDDLLDLCSVANISDVMQLSEFETRAMVNEGLGNINNKMLQEIIKQQDFSMKGIVNPHTISWYLAPLVNSYIRLATYEERILLLKAFCEIEDETFEYTKRGESFPIEENIYEHTVRLAKSYHGKQSRARDKAVKVLLNKAAEQQDNKVVILDSTDDVDKSLNGLVAIKISEAINKPVLIGKRMDDGTLSGSGRVFDNAPILDFRALTEKCSNIQFAQGHPSAFGFSLDYDKIDETIVWFNGILRDVDMDKVYFVDFIIDVDELTIDFIQEINNHSNVWCRGVDEPIIAIENITLFRSDIHIQGKNLDSIAFTINDIKYVVFKLPEEDPLLQFASEWDGNDDDEIVINAIVEVGINEYKGIYTPQCTLQNYEVVAQN